MPLRWHVFVIRVIYLEQTTPSFCSPCWRRFVIGVIAARQYYFATTTSSNPFSPGWPSAGADLQSVPLVSNILFYNYNPLLARICNPCLLFQTYYFITITTRLAQICNLCLLFQITYFTTITPAAGADLQSVPLNLNKLFNNYNIQYFFISGLLCRGTDLQSVPLISNNLFYNNNIQFPAGADLQSVPPISNNLFFNNNIQYFFISRWRGFAIRAFCFKQII